MLKINIKGFSQKGQNKKILKNINLNFEEKKIYCLLGENGSGKTTFLETLAFLYPIKTGIITIEDENNKILIKGKKNLKKGQQLSKIIPQYSDLEFFNETIKEDLLYGLDQRNNNNYLKKIKEYLKIMDLSEEILEKNYENISGGERKKIAIIAILILDFQILLLDEPFNNLDYKSIEILKNIIQKQKEEGKIIILSVHDNDVAYEVGDYIVELDNGEVKDFALGEEYFQKKFLREDILRLPEIKKYLLAYLKLQEEHGYPKKNYLKYYNKINTREELGAMIINENKE